MARDGKTDRPASHEGERDTVLKRLREAGLHPRKGLGQHFLHDPRILAGIAEAAFLDPADAVLEIGTGPGTLTRELALRARAVLTVEVDPAMLEFAREELRGLPAVRFLEADALDGRGGLHPALLSEARALGPFKLVANLPYSIATPLVLALVESGLPIELLVVTLQRELAQRLRAREGSRAYGPATALLWFWTTVEAVRPLPPGAFWPPPAVSSEVLRIRPRKEPLGPREIYPAYRAWVHRLFSQRRKQVGGLLRGLLGERESGEALRALALAPTLRPEGLAPEALVRMALRYPAFEFDNLSHPS